MSSSAAADLLPSDNTHKTEEVNHQSDVMESNHDLPARLMTDEERRQIQKEDPATMAASEELKHTTISDKITTESHVESNSTETEPTGEDKEMGDTGKASTPEPEPTDAQDEEMIERLSSPKKKRGRDQDEETRDLEDDNPDEPGSSADGSIVNGNRTTRLGPEKKRPRDTSEDPAKTTEVLEAKTEHPIVPIPLDTTKTYGTLTENKPSESSKKSIPENEKANPASSAFASSGFASLAASSTSPFGSLGATKPSVFSRSIPSTSSGFGALTNAKSPSSTTTTTISGFGATSGDKPTTGFGFGVGATSGFGGLGSGSVFGSKLGNGFAGGAGPKLSSFAAPGVGSTVIGAKPAKAFGAPESDEDEGSDEDESEGAAGTDDEDSGIIFPEEKKKFKASKVYIEDGEAGEATLLQIRAKLFALESKEAGWKERGVGTLKINVPQSCVSFDDNGQPIPGSFDTSELDADDADPTAPRVPRLIMRQESTHRVVLNTIIVRAMEFKDKPSAGPVQILFTAFEGDKEPKPINMLLKMSEANARLFRSEIDSIQHEL